MINAQAQGLSATKAERPPASLKEAIMAHNLIVGSIVTNFGQLARVVEVREAPYNDVILMGHGLDMIDGKWAADPAECKLAEGEPVYRHKTGLVIFS